MEFFAKLIELLNRTGVPGQLQDVAVKELFTNPWFLVPFVLFVGYNLYKQSVNTLVITALLVGLWIFSGSPMMEDLVIDGELQLGKVLPVAGIGVVAAGIAVYFLFMRSD